MWAPRRRLTTWLTLLAALASAGCALFPEDPRIPDRTHDPAGDPALGFHLISWRDFGDAGGDVWREAVRDLHAHGFRRATLNVVHFADPRTGAVHESDGTSAGPRLEHLGEAMREARSLGMAVSVVPFVEPDGFAFWRGQLSFGGAARDRFFAEYRDYVREVAEAAEAGGAARLAIGTELRALVTAAENGDALTALIDEVGAIFSGRLGYAANWDSYRHPTLTEIVWEHPRIDHVGVDAYYPLASAPQARVSGPFPDEGLIAVVRDAWDAALDELVAFAAARKGGSGMPVVLNEHGLIPYELATLRPYSDGPARQGAPPDTDEQLNGYAGLLTALAGRAPDVLEVTFWHWGMPGAEGSAWYQHPDPPVGAASGESDEALQLGRRAGRYLSDYASGEITVLGHRARR